MLDHGAPAEFRAKSRAGLDRRYKDIEFRTVQVVKARKNKHATFEVEDEQGVEYKGREAILTNGVRDRVEDMPDGFGECYGKGM